MTFRSDAQRKAVMSKLINTHPHKFIELENKKMDKTRLFYQQLNIGTNVELEHTDNYMIARKIAQDHLKEDPIYYTKLKKAGL